MNGPPPPLAQIRDTAQALLAQGKVDETWDFFVAALDAVLVKNRELELLVLKLRRERIGRHSERLDPRQIALLFEALLARAGPARRSIRTRRPARTPRSIARSPTPTRRPPPRGGGRRGRRSRAGAPRG